MPTHPTDPAAPSVTSTRRSGVRLSTAAVARPASGFRALVAGPDAELRHRIASALHRDGFVVSEARDGREVLEIVEAARREDGRTHDLVVADVGTAGRSGLEVLGVLREWLRDAQILVVASRGDETTLAKARAIGALGVLEKPFDIDDVRTIALLAAQARPPRQSAG